MKNIYSPRFFFFIMIFILAACTSAPPAKNDSKMDITVSILPEKYFVERIGGDLVSVNVMVGPGDSPHTYEPKPDQMAALSRSSVYFRIGVEFENAWLDRIASANPKMAIVDLSAGIDKLPLPAHEGEDSDEGEFDPHVWTSPELVKPMAEQIYAQLVGQDPDHKSIYRKNLDVFLEDIEALDLEILTTLSGLQNRRFMVFHPAWGYFAHEYGLKEISIEIGGTEPSASELASLISTAKAEDIRVIFAQPEFSTQIAEYLASEINGEVVLISPLAEDWLENLRQVAQTFKNSL